VKRRKVVLYNPRADFHTMPLALVALGSALDSKRYQVRILDGRLDGGTLDSVVSETKDALCLGVTVLTGAPIGDALRISRAVKSARPDLAVVWGGWHPSLFPVESLVESGVDATVQGQGELTFAEILERLAEGAGLEDVPGSTHGGLQSPPRAMVDVNGLPGHDYDLIPVETYFARKGRRQLDYISSQGCRFRCTFCADPTVYRRAWFGLDPERVGAELARLFQRHRYEDVSFQDETFFTHASRVAAIAEEILRRDLRFTWMATLRADQGVRIGEAALAACRQAGLRRVMVGLESGSQSMLDWMKKDVTISQVFETAEKLKRLGIAALFNLIVGFPDEPPESVDETLQVAKRLRATSPDFQVAFFYYRPYPGTEITAALARAGHRLPRGLEEWARFDDVARPGPWVDARKHRLVERFKFYQQVAFSPPTPVRAPLQALARWRCRRDFYRYPVEKAVVEKLRPLAPQG
jgi:radical SAM superfamily enzyme YgiQ (UPF0313 family)